MTEIGKFDFTWDQFNHTACKGSVNVTLLCKEKGQIEETEKSILAALREIKQFQVKVKSSEVFGNVLVASFFFQVKKDKFVSNTEYGMFVIYQLTQVLKFKFGYTVEQGAEKNIIIAP